MRIRHLLEVGVALFLTGAVSGSAAAQGPLPPSFPPTHLEYAFNTLRIPYQKTVTNQPGHFLYFLDLRGIRARMHYFYGQDLLLEADDFRKTFLERLNKWNATAKYSRASINVVEGQTKSTLTSKLPLTGDVTIGAIHQFIRRFEAEAASFESFINVSLPNWISDMDVGMAICRTNRKPMAIFAGPGPGGYHHVVRQDRLDPEVQEMLSAKYVCVFLDTATPYGKQLAAMLEIRSGVGVILTDRTGDRQALWHDGTLSNYTLWGYLHRVADPEYIVVRTMIHQPLP